MITAEEARKVSNETYESRIAAEVAVLDVIIRNSSKEGKFEFNSEGTLCNGTIEVLRSHGYTVRQGASQYVISWKGRIDHE